MSQEIIGHGPRHLKHVLDLLQTCFQYSTVVQYNTVLYFYKFKTMILNDLQTSALHKNGVEFCQEFNGHGLRHVTHVFLVSDMCFSFQYCTVFNICSNKLSFTLVPSSSSFFVHANPSFHPLVASYPF